MRVRGEKRRWGLRLSGGARGKKTVKDGKKTVEDGRERSRACERRDSEQRERTRALTQEPGLSGPDPTTNTQGFDPSCEEKGRVAGEVTSNSSISQLLRHERGFWKMPWKG